VLRIRATTVEKRKRKEDLMSDNLPPRLLETSSPSLSNTITGVALRTAHTPCLRNPTVSARLPRRALVVARHHIASSAASNVVDGGNHALPPHLSLQLLVEAEYRSLAGRMNVAGAASAGFEGSRGVAVEGCQRGWAGRCWARCDGGGGVEVDDVACTASAGVEGWAAARD